MCFCFWVINTPHGFARYSWCSALEYTLMYLASLWIVQKFAKLIFRTTHTAYTRGTPPASLQFQFPLFLGCLSSQKRVAYGALFIDALDQRSPWKQTSPCAHTALHLRVPSKCCAINKSQCSTESTQSLGELHKYTQSNCRQCNRIKDTHT